MKNTITNYKGEAIPHTEYATIDMIHTNNISKDDVKFILKARRAKRKALRRRETIGDIIYFLIGLTCVFFMLWSGGHIENSTEIGWGDFWESLGLMAIGIIIGWFGWNRGRHLEAFKEVAACFCKIVIVTIAYIVECVEDVYNFFKTRFATK